MTYHLQNSMWLNPTAVPEGMNLKMINHPSRLSLLYPAIDLMPKDQVVIDAGCGTGLLGLRSLSKGAKFVYFVEQDVQMFHILEETLSNTLDNKKYKLIHSDIENLDRNDFVNNLDPTYMISEFFGPTLFDEGYVSYTRYIRSLFPNISFIPEIFETEVFLSDVDYKDPIWPQSNVEVLEHFRLMYSQKGFTNSYVREEVQPHNPVYQGSIVYNADTQEFSNKVFLEHVGEERLIFCHNTIKHASYKQNWNWNGWYMYPSDSQKKYAVEISVDPTTLYYPLLNEVI